MTWPGGWGTPMHLVGHARDLLTPRDGGTPVVLAEDGIRAQVDGQRTLEAITCGRPEIDLAPLVGARAGGGFRSKLAELVPDELNQGTPLYLLLDDLAGATLVAGFAFTQWPGVGPDRSQLQRQRRTTHRTMEGICAGFAAGASALSEHNGTRVIHDVRPVVPLPATDDPYAWHALLDISEVSMRRSRRIDVFDNGDVLEIDSFFQDSTTSPDGRRIAVHEYRVLATADSESGEVLSVVADPRVLPFQECPMAASNVDRLVGARLADFRTEVLSRLPGTLGCTHLNDVLRDLAEVPILARYGQR